MDEYYRAIRALPPVLQQELSAMAPRQAAAIQEVRLRAGQGVQFTVAGRLVACGRLLPHASAAARLDAAMLRRCFASLCGYSAYAHEEELKEGYLTLPGGSRVGVAGVRGPGGFAAVTSLTLRIARWGVCALPAPLQSILDRLDGGLLVAGPPGSGKTTLLRSMLARLAGQDKIVCVADERGELLADGAGDTADKLPVNCDVFARCSKAQAVAMAVRCMNPQIMLCDEIGTGADVQALEQGAAAGVTFLASAHARTFEQLARQPPLRRLLDAGVFTHVVLLAGRAQPGRIERIVPL